MIRWAIEKFKRQPQKNRKVKCKKKILRYFNISKVVDESLKVRYDGMTELIRKDWLMTSYKWPTTGIYASSLNPILTSYIVKLSLVIWTSPAVLAGLLWILWFRVEFQTVHSLYFICQVVNFVNFVCVCLCLCGKFLNISIRGVFGW